MVKKNRKLLLVRGLLSGLSWAHLPTSNMILYHILIAHIKTTAVWDGAHGAVKKIIKPESYFSVCNTLEKKSKSNG